jgi:hypothetical protein
MDITFEFQLADTPTGKPVGTPIPETAAVEMVIACGKGVPMHTKGTYDGLPTEGGPFTTIYPIASSDSQPPVRGIE